MYKNDFIDFIYNSTDDRWEKFIEKVDELSDTVVCIYSVNDCRDVADQLQISNKSLNHNNTMVEYTTKLLAAYDKFNRMTYEKTKETLVDHIKNDESHSLADYKELSDYWITSFNPNIYNISDRVEHYIEVDKGCGKEIEKNINVGDKVYIYESKGKNKCNRGKGIIATAIVVEIIKTKQKNLKGYLYEDEESYVDDFEYISDNGERVKNIKTDNINFHKNSTYHIRLRISGVLNKNIFYSSEHEKEYHKYLEKTKKSNSNEFYLNAIIDEESEKEYLEPILDHSSNLRNFYQLGTSQAYKIENMIRQTGYKPLITSAEVGNKRIER